ncbi:glycoside hydrolase family 47 protein [Vararia minispora EC-137]|uniref:Glycoside hydrolase family 47 protein n=1 Tax=Vararia minispora EC-137 TaxID=1314806 RepID=A0ACB8QUT8_9AGAM|nr:glycoside hydrolase family 47 protein [Vararia minispora EC-137]
MTRRLLLSILALSTACPRAHAGKVQADNLLLPSDAATHKQAVVDIFTASYSNYKTFAFGHDQVSPISNGFNDPRNGWGATIYIMGLNDLFAEAVNFSQKIDFTVAPTTPTDISVFESTIRYVGGLISAYELSGAQYPGLVDKAEQLTRRMVDIAYSRGNVIPFGHVNFAASTPNVAGTNIAEAGTLSLEYQQLSQLTGNDTFRQLAEGSVRHIVSLGGPLPGFPAQCISPTTGSFTCQAVTWGGGSDSYIEYLIKYARLTNTEDTVFADAWKKAVDTSIKTLLKTSTVGNWTYLADYDGSRIVHVGSHLACFHAGNWILGGKLTNNDTIVNIGLALNDGCWNTYASTTTGIGPEVFAWISADGNFTGGTPTASELAFYNAHGFYVTNGVYIQRPEVLESNFYAWRATGDTKYLDRAAAAIDSFNKYLSVGSGGGYSGIGDVTSTNSGHFDETESFWYAEVLKYLYLTFDDPTHISLDEYVFNTEAHPFRAPAARNSY